MRFVVATTYCKLFLLLWKHAQ